MTERAVQNEIRNALAVELAGQGALFRANVGQVWTGDVQRLANGDVLIRNARPFTTGLPAGFADLFGVVPVTITAEHIGQRLGRFVAIEVKTKTGRVSDLQAKFLAAIRRLGGVAGEARSVADALALVRSVSQ